MARTAHPGPRCRQTLSRSLLSAGLLLVAWVAGALPLPHPAPALAAGEADDLRTHPAFLTPQAPTAAGAQELTTTPAEAAADSGTTAGDPAAVLFTEKCSSCHTIGSGDKTGPDLKGVTDRRSIDWLRRFVKTPRGLYRGGDPTAVELFGRFAPNVMPDQALSDDQVDLIMDLIARVTASGRPFVPVGGGLPRAMAPGDTTMGRRYFTGALRLSGGAPACISCHTNSALPLLGGGTLGPDLTKANVTYNEAELVNILRNPAFPTMANTFANRPLDDEELVQVYAYLTSVRDRDPVGASGYFLFTGTGMLLVLAAMAAMALMGRNRLRGVRRPMVESAGHPPSEGDRT